MSILILLFVWLLPAALAHIFYAISLTSAHRLGLIAAISDNNPVYALNKLDALQRISFDQHFSRVVTFRNPWKLYPTEILGDEIWRVA